MVWLRPTAELHCTSWTLLPLLLLEMVLIGLILWRTFHQLYWSSHRRRILFHIVRLHASRGDRTLVIHLSVYHTMLCATGVARVLCPSFKLLAWTVSCQCTDHWCRVLVVVQFHGAPVYRGRDFSMG